MSICGRAAPEKLQHGMLLDAKDIMDNVLGRLHDFKEYIPECLHSKANQIIEDIEWELTRCDVSKHYEEKP